MQSRMRAITADKARHVDQILMHKWGARENAISGGYFGLREGLFETPTGQRIEFRLEFFSSGDTRRYQLTRRYFASFQKRNLGC